MIDNNCVPASASDERSAATPAVKVPGRPGKVPASHVGRVENIPHPAGGTMRVTRHPGSGQFMPKKP